MLGDDEEGEMGNWRGHPAEIFMRRVDMSKPFWYVLLKVEVHCFIKTPSTIQNSLKNDPNTKARTPTKRKENAYYLKAHNRIVTIGRREYSAAQILI